MPFAVDAVLPPGIREAREAAVQYEKLGFDAVYSTETRSDPFLDLALPAVETTRPLVGTNLAIAFARSPFVTAASSWQLQSASSGRFVLGLGTQVKGHIERRFGMTWEAPGPKMREYIEALHALWNAFASGERPDFRGRYYNHTVLTPFFDPGPMNHPAPPVWLAAVNEYNAETVGLVGDGLLVHPVHSPRYLEEVLLPAVDRGLERSGRTRADVTIVCPVFLIVGRNEAERAPADSFVRSQVAFYGSTRTYRRIFECHGWDETPTRLHELMRSGDLGGMSAQVTEEMLETFAIVADPGDVADRVRRRYEGLADRLYFYNLFASPYAGDEEGLRELMGALRG